MQIDGKRVILGTAQLGFRYGIANTSGQPSIEEAKNILRSASSHGIIKLDTAVAYGSSQEVLGKIHDSRFGLMSKWGDHPSELSTTLELLKTEKLETWMAHRSKIILKNPEFWKSMLIQKDSGLVGAIGVSVYRISEVEALLEADIVPDVIQLPINILSHEETESILRIRRLGISIHARSIFLQGLFLCNPKSLDSFFDPVKPWLSAFSERFPTIPSKVQALIREVLDKPSVDFVVLGAESASQIEDWFDSSNFTDEQLPEIPGNLPEEILNPSMWPQL